MNNIHLERDTKEQRFLAMTWKRKEETNEIIGFEGTVKHFYSYKSRKKLNQDWQMLNLFIGKMKRTQPAAEAKKKKAIGFQLTKQGVNGVELPEGFWSFEILTREVCRLWKQYNDSKREWTITPVYAGDIEEPSFRNTL